MKVEDIKIGMKIKFKSLESCSKLKILFDKAVRGSNLNLYVISKSVFEVYGIDTKCEKFNLKLFSWDKPAKHDCNLDSSFATSHGDATLPYKYVDLVEEHIVEDHSGMTYNPYSNSWSFL